MGVEILIGMAIGAAVGGVSSAVQGGNILTGMLMGGTIGAVTGGIGGAVAGHAATAAATAGTTAGTTSASTGFMSGISHAMASTAFNVGSHAVSWGSVAGGALSGVAGGQTAVLQSMGNGQVTMVDPSADVEKAIGAPTDALADRQAKLRALALSQNDANNNSFSINPENGGQAKTNYISNNILGTSSQVL